MILLSSAYIHVYSMNTVCTRHSFYWLMLKICFEEIDSLHALAKFLPLVNYLVTYTKSISPVNTCTYKYVTFIFWLQCTLFFTDNLFSVSCTKEANQRSVWPCQKRKFKALKNTFATAKILLFFLWFTIDRTDSCNIKAFYKTHGIYSYNQWNYLARWFFNTNPAVYI